MDPDSQSKACLASLKLEEKDVLLGTVEVKQEVDTFNELNQGTNISVFGVKEEIDIKYHAVESEVQPSDQETIIPYAYCDATDSSHLYQAQNEILCTRNEHSESDIMYKCKKCGQNSYVDIHINAEHSKVKKYECNVCNEKMFCCNICSKTFSRKRYLNRHRAVHAGYRPYTCNICNKTFSESGNLTKHMRIHTGERPYSCHICSKTFTTLGNLTIHLTIHTKDRLYSCDICSKTFSISSHLKRHMRVHTNDRPYSCNICSKTFNESGNLTAHMRIHTGDRPYTCNICSKTFIVSSHLTRHMRVHTGEKPRHITCNICSKSFSLSSHLKRHMRVHTGERPYSCFFCDMKFTQLSNMHVHMKRKHV